MKVSFYGIGQNSLTFKTDSDSAVKTGGTHQYLCVDTDSVNMTVTCKM